MEQSQERLEINAKVDKNQKVLTAHERRIKLYEKLGILAGSIGLCLVATDLAGASISAWAYITLAITIAAIFGIRQLELYFWNRKLTDSYFTLLESLNMPDTKKKGEQS